MIKNEVSEALCVLCSNLEINFLRSQLYYLNFKKVSLTCQRKALGGPQVDHTPYIVKAWFTLSSPLSPLCLERMKAAISKLYS
jgi:hypothetical protein